MATARLKNNAASLTTSSADEQRFIEAPQISVSERDFALIKKSIANPPEPNAALLELAAQYRQTIEESR